MANKQYGKLKIVWHPEKLVSFAEERITAPIYVRLKPTNVCNHHCYYCSYEPDFNDIREVSRRDELPREKIMEILDDFKDMGVRAVTYSGGGEPLVYPHITETLEKTLRYGIDLSMITNGQRLNGENAELLKQGKWVRISSDSLNAKLYAETRRVPESWFYELKNNIESFAKTKPKTCELGVNFVVQEKNAEHVYDSVKFFRELGVDHMKITPMHVPGKFFEYHKPFKENVIGQIKRAKQDFSDFTIHDTYEADFNLTETNERKYDRCYVMQTIPVIAADSKVYFCHDKAYSENGVLGSISDKSFKELWFSKEAYEKFMNFDPRQGCRNHCANDQRNVWINEMIESKGDHVNFI
ncbi:Coenzyme PQQ synthesis protein E [uncultured archaeon]|nr:Coenzyme PQQ synthesis protein E [uncultured archaeon]